MSEVTKQWFEKESQEFVIDGFVRAEEFESAETIYDLVFMDIVLPEDNGIDLFERLQQTGRVREVIYVSAHDRNVFQVFGSRPIAYIRKAFLETDLERAMRLYEEHIRKSKVYIMEGKKVHCFYPDEIMYLQSNNHYIEFYMGDGGRFLIRGKMDDMERALKGYGYIRIHASYLVNVKYIKCVEKNHV